jgi:ATP-binding cassette, subfamily C, bacterial CydD
LKVTASTAKTSDDMHIQRRLFRLAADVHGFLPMMAIYSLLIAAVVLCQMFLVSKIIADAFMSAVAPAPAIMVLLLSTMFARSALLWLRERTAQKNAVTMKSSLRKEVFKHILHLGPSFTKSEKTGELVSLVMEGIEKLDDYFTKFVPSLVHIIILPALITLFTIYIDWLSGLILLITAPLILFFMWLIGTYAKQLTQRQWKEMSNMSSHFLDVLQGLKTLKILGKNTEEAKQVYTSSNRFRLITMKVLRLAFLSGMVLELAASISIALVALQVGIRLIEGLMIYQLGLFILLLAPEFYLPFRTLGQHHHAGMEAAAAGEKIFQLLSIPVQQENNRKKAFDAPPRLSVEFVNVGFNYPGSSTPALQGIHCKLEPGTLSAIVGKTGSGKTTFAYLLLGFLNPSMGHILVNGSPRRSHQGEEWQKLLAYVPQHPHFFNGTIHENLLMANPKAGTKDLTEAAEKAGALEFIQNLPDGFETLLTENASRLSGGEKQRLAIARAFLKKAPVLIMDEPTSNLDPESEKMIAMATEELVKDRTALIIAHRLRTVKMAGQIMVFDQGMLTESGTHQGLINDRGIYAGYIGTLDAGKGGRA